MISRRREDFSLATTLCAATWLMIGLAGPAQAQHTPDPYNIVGEYNNQYEPYMYATYPTASGTQPNQGRYDRSGVRNANSFQNFLNGDEEDVSEFGRAAPRYSGPGMPYYRAYRRFDQEFQRTYRPNETADRSYYDEQEKRNDKYFQALREPDPRKRAQLLRDYNLDNMRAARDLSSGRNASEKDREIARDRVSTGGASLPPESPQPSESPVPTLTAPALRRPTTGAALSSAPPARGRTGTSAPPGAGSSAPTAPRPSSSSVVPAPSRVAPRAASSASELLKRSELMDRARRSTAPTVPRSTAPPAPR